MEARKPGAWLEDEQGNLTPNLNDEAMAKRHKENEKPVSKKEKSDAASAN